MLTILLLALAFGLGGEAVSTPRPIVYRRVVVPGVPRPPRPRLERGTPPNVIPGTPRPPRPIVPHR